MNVNAPTQDTPTVHPTYARMLCMVLRSQGINIDDALRSAGLGTWRDLATADQLLSYRSVSRLIEAAVRASGRPCLGLELGAAVQISAHGPMGYAVVASRDLRQALETVARYAPLRNGMARYRLRDTADCAVFELTERLDLGEGRVFVLSMVFATLVRLMETVVGHKLDGMRVDLPFSDPLWEAEFARVFGGRLRFGTRHMAFHIEREQLSEPCITADARAHASACMECEQLSSNAANVPLAQRVREFLLGREGHYPTISEVAVHFSMSQRTLIRHLKQGGSSYQALLDEARQRRAMWYLCHTTHTMEEIADRLGYKDTTNFSRTFRRWFGKTPGDARRGGPGE